MTAPDSTAAPKLVRALGRWDLVAFVINGILGAGIFGLPAKVHALLGAWGLVAIMACAGLIGVVILCFAEVSSRFTETGGPYLYITEAFGPVPGFLAGWLLWVARITGICAISGVLAEYTSFLIPSVAHGLPRAALITSVVGGFSLLHVSGVRRAAQLGNIITIAKLAPLFVFVGVGLPAIDPVHFNFSVHPTNRDFSAAVLLLAFAFVGWETALVAAGELRDPRKDTPFALMTGLAGVAVLYVGIQAVCVGTLPALATSARPLADASLVFLGPAGATLIVVGAAISMLGTINGGVLTISRLPFAMAESGQLPRLLAGLHPVYKTPVPAIVLSALVVLLLTLTNSHVYLLTISTIARLLVFAATCAALPALRRSATAPPALLTVPGGFLLPGAALCLIVWLLASTSWRETRDVGVAALIGVAVLGLQRLLGARDQTGKTA
jgi:amino acid transporter